MYPNLHFAFRDLFGMDESRFGFLRFINSFGFFVAIAFLVAAYFLILELKRKEGQGLLMPVEVKVTIGAPASITDLLINFFLGFVFGYKFLGLFLSNETASADPQGFIFSMQGSAGAGILVGGIFAAIKWYEKSRVKLAKPEERSIRIWPHDRVGDVVVIAAITGFLGAKIFHNLENWHEFWQNPIAALLSFSGLTFYGGLICATIALYFFAKKYHIGFRNLCDAAAPALLIAYAIGRMGCMVSGDGDWGVLNSAYILNQDGVVVEATDTSFKQQLALHAPFYQQEFPDHSIDQIPHHTVKAPLGLPVWTVAYTFPNNVLSYGIPVKGCTSEQYCRQLPSPVFPTSMYETILGFLLFVLLWFVRKRFVIPGQLFSVYLILNGLERFMIEKIRVNTTYTIGGFHPTQAELISGSMIIGGTILFMYLRRKVKA